MNYVIYNGDNIEAIYSTLEEATIAGAEDFSEITDEKLDEIQRSWRDKALKESDWIVAITDHPERANYLAYRSNLRDWPSTEDFPNTKPTL